ncbi:MAG: ATP-grasp ribosomal peptide maturase [Micromonosporaceae bacterium]
MTVLMLAEAGDATADLMAAELQRRGPAVSRVDTADFPRRLRMVAPPGAGCLWIDGYGVHLTEVRSVYRRSPAFFDMAPRMSAPERRFAEAEAVQGFGGALAAALRCPWINHPSRVADATYKPVQLDVAATVGMRVPRTLITNDGKAAAAFAAEVGQVIYKPMSLGVIAEQSLVHVVNATRLSTADIDPVAIGRTACMFQEWVPKTYDVRLTAVGRKCFAVAIRTDDRAAHADWRANFDALAYEIVHVPDDIRVQVAAYLDRFGLLFGAFDFSVTDDAWWFLECNPNGQWGWLQEETGLPIAAALADLLTGADQ